MSNVGLPSAKGSGTSGYVQKNLSSKLTTKHFQPMERKRVADPKLIEHNAKRQALLKKMQGSKEGPTFLNKVSSEVDQDMRKEKQMEDFANALGIDRSKHIEGEAFKNIKRLEPVNVFDCDSSSSDTSTSSSSDSDSENESDESSANSEFKLNDKFTKADKIKEDLESEAELEQLPSPVPDILSTLRMRVEDSKRKPSERIKERLLNNNKK